MPGIMLRIKLRVNSKVRISGIRVPAYLPAMKRRQRRRSRVGAAAAANENESERTMTIWILIIGTMALSLFAAARVKSVYHRYNRGTVLSGVTGGEAAALILRQAGIRDVEIAVQDQMLGDHYDPIHKRLVLSSENFHGSTPAALGVAAHECGHAIQHARAYKPLHWRMAAVGITTYANQVVMWLPLLGMFTGLIQPMVAVWILALAWGVIMLFNLVTLPVEFDASRRAKLVLRNLEPDRARLRSHRREQGAQCGGLDLRGGVHHLAGLLPVAPAAAARRAATRLKPRNHSTNQTKTTHETDRATPSPAVHRRTGFAHRRTNPRLAAPAADRRGQRAAGMPPRRKPGLQRPRASGHARPGRVRREPGPHHPGRHRQGHGGTGSAGSSDRHETRRSGASAATCRSRR